MNDPKPSNSPDAPGDAPDHGVDPYDVDTTEPVDLKGRTRTQRIVRRIELTIICGVFLLAAVAGGIGYWGWTTFTEPGPLSQERTLVIPAGSGVRTIASTLSSEGVIEWPRVFVIAARLTGLHAKLKAGEYEFPTSVSQREVLSILVSGKTVDRFVTIPEGLTVAEVLAILEDTPGLEGEIDKVPPEGSLLPETYHYERGADRADILAHMRQSMDETLGRLWEARAPGLPFGTPREAVTLASIVEKETGIAEERPMIAGVFVNRLEKGMRLQSDPTVVYALTGGSGALGRALTRQDWEVDHPYNTYRNAGLPPGPIANPGMASLKAVLRPEETDALFFVADGTGGHAFAETLEEHNRNVAKWRRIRDQKD